MLKSSELLKTILAVPSFLFSKVAGFSILYNKISVLFSKAFQKKPENTLNSGNFSRFSVLY